MSKMNGSVTVKMDVLTIDIPSNSKRTMEETPLIMSVETKLGPDENLSLYRALDGMMAVGAKLNSGAVVSTRPDVVRYICEQLANNQ